ncbi:hypothetical protein [Burkholderia sp. LMG 32019]|uniref:hypothetical protein n=1 Tax=Burkholderia sp. LMG 32019 TaxID=3158173 RepID=UPI003C302C73
MIRERGAHWFPHDFKGLSSTKAATDRAQLPSVIPIRRAATGAERVRIGVDLVLALAFQEDGTMF